MRQRQRDRGRERDRQAYTNRERGGRRAEDAFGVKMDSMLTNRLVACNDDADDLVTNRTYIFSNVRHDSKSAIAVHNATDLNLCILPQNLVS